MTLWCVVPAAGTGSRLGAAIPKQYLQLAERPLVCWALAALAQLMPRAILLVVAPQDEHARTLPDLPPVTEILRSGGTTRAASVLAGLDALAGRAAADDWVLVHDAARPCVAPARIAELLALVADHADGGLLALPVDETVKEQDADTGCSRRTLDRSTLWLAQTPQVFRYQRLRTALTGALEAGFSITDEASAMEWSGARPLLVAGDRSNLKVTRTEDLALAAFWLEQSRTIGAMSRDGADPE